MTSKKYKTMHWTLVGLIILMGVLFVAFMGLTIYEKKQNELVKEQEISTITYSIYLSDGNTYTQDNGNSYSSSNIDKINVNINYYNDEFTNYTLSGYIATYVKGANVNLELYSMIGSSETIKSNEKVITKSTNVVYSIDYKKYEDKIREYITSQGISQNSTGKLELVLTATNTSTKESNKAIVEIPVLESNVSINTIETISIEEDVTLDSNITLFLVAAVLAFGAAIVLAVLDYFVLKISKMSEFDRSIYTIFKLNKGVLVNGDTSVKSNEESIIKVGSFKELLKVQNSVSLPIMYTKSDNDCKFFIKAGSWEYRYILNKETK